ncbi:5-oxoprolinase subunit PxpB [Pseudoalteromonas luteoviolacea]|uniref:5-oxoprolinase subunit PxpB n=1 Tax=Pseudoalteromonas luteoviolacea TaxID=43657 RepID=UPI001F401E0A|nr:5-oxoprolinase subunit PxpB [Pseudoalteromonas luteoviolacea]MCF6442290.1 5-oxoprolinase subunit PxpB [Pseudoalteromonas luteoviolacea]
MTNNKIYILGERALVLEITQSNLSQYQQNKLFALHAWMREQKVFIDIVPAKTTITGYLMHSQDPEYWLDKMQDAWQNIEPESFEPTVHTILTHYGKHYGPDLQSVASLTGLSQSQIVELHSQCSYQVKFLGFLPGFAYLGDLHPQLHLPRLESPRTHVPKGSVAIAQDLTAVYPSESPGGWRLIGHTDTVLFNHNLDSPSILQPGDVVKFLPSTEGIC